MRLNHMKMTIFFVCAMSGVWAAEGRIALRFDLPEGGMSQALPVSGGVPLPRGAVASQEHLRLVDAQGIEIPSQMTRLAVWPDGSVKWILVDAVVVPAQVRSLALEYGPQVRRARVPQAIRATARGDVVRIEGGGVRALVRRGRRGVLESLSIDRRPVISAPARLLVETIRTADGTSGAALLPHTFVIRDAQARHEAGEAVIETLEIEQPGPIRATVVMRGHVALPTLGASLPSEATQNDPAGRLPFSLRLSFWAGSGLVLGQHKLVFSGEPDCDFIIRWGIELPGQAGREGTLILGPGVTLTQREAAFSVATDQTRLCWAPLRDGFALIREGWQNHPVAITQEGRSAVIDFWPRAAGAWDLRRYAREWAVGESGDMNDPESIQRFAKFAARGIAKSHNFVLYFGQPDLCGAAPAIVRSLSGRSLLVATPDWYASTGALGLFAPVRPRGRFVALDAASMRSLDYYLFNQDLFRWYGKLVYGFWQTWFGQVHRQDRWGNDYGRWGWSLNDGGGRIGHALMLQYLRTLERRYFEAGEAFSRINYDTNLVHTVRHLQNTRSWRVLTGCAFRHNVQPFGCPYIGMRGANPGGQRIVHLLTGDGVIGDGLDLVAEAAYLYTQGQGGRLGVSGGSDGQGSGALALLWKYETSGERKYLDACRQMLDRSNLIPIPSGGRLGYGPSFGLFNAAGEYAEISGDEGFRARFIALARQCAQNKDSRDYLYTIAQGYRLSGDKSLRSALATALDAEVAARARQEGLEDLPVERWPGHGGWRTPTLDANAMRDYPHALGVFEEPSPTGSWPTAMPPLASIPASIPKNWFRPGGVQARGETVPEARRLLTMRPGNGGDRLEVGGAAWTMQATLCDRVEVNGAEPLAGAVVPYVDVLRPQDGEGPRLGARFQRLAATIDSIGRSEGGVVATASAGSARFVVTLRRSSADGVPSVRVEAACQMTRPVRIASWGLLVPLTLGRNGHAIQTTAPGAFRLERCRLDQNDERVPAWLAAMERRESLPHWPLWRLSGIEAGPGRFYRIWRASGEDTSAVFTDEGEGAPSWFDVTDRGVTPRWGLTARLLRPATSVSEAARQAIRMDKISGVMEIQFHSAAAPPFTLTAAGVSGAADIIFHDGWRPPLAKPELTAQEYERFIDDLNYGGNYGLNALRFRRSTTHQVKGRQWMEQIRDLGIEPREILYGMQWRDGLADFCSRIEVRWDANDLEGSVRRVIAHYRGRR